MAIERRNLAQLFADVNWLHDSSTVSFDVSNLLVSLQAAWRTAPKERGSLGRSPRTKQVTSWLDATITAGGQLALLSDQFPLATRWLGERLVFWPRSRPSGRFVGVVSSRLGRQLDTRADWFTVLRAACSMINRNDDVLLTAATTTPERFMLPATELFGVNVLSLVPPRDAETIANWCVRMQKLSHDSDCGMHQVYLSPWLAENCDNLASNSIREQLPTADQAIVSMSQQLLVFHLRKRGNLDSLIRMRLVDASWPPASIMIALGDDLVDRQLGQELLDLGAVGWVVLDTLHGEDSPLGSVSNRTRTQVSPIVEMPEDEGGEWLTHCTRQQKDGWPDEDRDSYIKDLLKQECQQDRSAFGTLQRIVSSQKLIATSRMTRDSTDVVSFTAVPPQSISELRTFRAHVGRWDFEPYGICIRKEWLERRGSKPVRYGDDSLWASLAESERPFFQVSMSGKQRRGKAIDWTVEQEWRHPGDIDLAELPADQAVVFVPTHHEAELLSAISRWPIAVMPVVSADS